MQYHIMYVVGLISGGDGVGMCGGKTNNDDVVFNKKKKKVFLVFYYVYF